MAKDFFYLIIIIQTSYSTVIREQELCGLIKKKGTYASNLETLVFLWIKNNFK